jgi:Zn-dependent protease
MEFFIFSTIIFIFSVILHEVAHGYAAYLQGDNTARNAGRLTLNPVSHIDPFGSIILPLLLIISNSPMVIGWAKPVPFNPYNLRNQRRGEALVALAGPLTNIIIAVVFGILIQTGMLPQLSAPFAYIVLINLVLAIFNLVPIPPLDGSKILFSFLPYSMQHIRNTLEAYGPFILIFFVFVFWDRVFPIIDLLFRLLTGV